MRFFVLFVALSILSSSPSARPQGSTPASPSLEQILAAIRTVETGGTRNGGRGVTGDGGRAIGPFQVHRAHWIDSRLPGRYEDCHDPEYARREVVAYWQRWCPEALEQRDAEVLARIHNGGPRGARKASTLPFWRKVQRALDARPKPVPVVTPRVVGLSGATAPGARPWDAGRLGRGSLSNSRPKKRLGAPCGLGKAPGPVQGSRRSRPWAGGSGDEDD